MSATVGYSTLRVDGGARAVTIVATDGREATISKAEVQDWFAANRQGTLLEGSVWAGELLTARWAALGGVAPLAFYLHLLSRDPLVCAVLVCGAARAPSATWWLDTITPH